jgi:hypothetical protein
MVSTGYWSRFLFYANICNFECSSHTHPAVPFQNTCGLSLAWISWLVTNNEGCYCWRALNGWGIRQLIMFFCLIGWHSLIEYSPYFWKAECQDQKWSCLFNIQLLITSIEQKSRPCENIFCPIDISEKEANWRSLMESVRILSVSNIEYSSYVFALHIGRFLECFDMKISCKNSPTLQYFNPCQLRIGQSTIYSSLHFLYF